MRYIIVGLGNIGGKYKFTRHNVGFMALDRYAKKQGYIFTQNQSLESMIVKTPKLILLKPLTYMNLSGRAILKASNYYDIPVTNIIVIHDEIDINFQSIKVKIGGGNAGHNGLKSIQELLKSPDFWRIRVGVSRPAHDASSYVLSNFSSSEIDYLPPILDRAIELSLKIVEDNIYEK